ncbi:DNA-3-methyladenine glycosylase I, partial [Mesorhizobium japonicum]|uniref:DNA-3-methyladenine glycosylase I n=1 Tax=Mesorhizobium japonicum TaxID=2066070 RepID=UPI003B59DC43
VTGADGVVRCAWAGSAPEYLRYHDEEWGTVLHGDQALFERMSLEGFQAGLSWITILRRRETFRAAFAEFDIDTVAAFDAHDVARLMADPGIIRNAAKVDA